MKLAAIYNVFDGVELLPYSIKSIANHVDVVIIVYQNTSNFGEEKRTDVELSFYLAPLIFKNIAHAVYFRPKQINGTKNEIEKRQLGLEKAKEMNCTHFLFMDCDEIYEDFGRAKKEFIQSGANGSVCKMFTYFKWPTLRFEYEDNYFVPFIHELKKDTVCGVKEYPFYVDPTRKVNCNSVALINERMHHFSWVRKDIEMKVRNSSAKSNIEKSTLLKDYYNEDCKEGYHVDGFGQKLIRVENKFLILF